MTRGAEEKAAFRSAEGAAGRVGGDGVRRFVLEGKPDVVAHPVALFEGLLHVCEGLFEERLMLRRDCDGEVAAAVVVAHIFTGFHEVLRKSGPGLGGITVEKDDALGLAAVAETRLAEDL